MPIQLKPIGKLITECTEKYQAPYQPILDDIEGIVQLDKGENFEQALEDLLGFERVWLISVFDRALSWKTKVQAPRCSSKKGVFSTRSPHRPNAIGMSCVQLIKIEGLNVYVKGHDLLDQTPILDIKPYLSYCDAYVNVRQGWVDEIENQKEYRIIYKNCVYEKLNWLKEKGLNLQIMIETTLRLMPLENKKKRIQKIEEGSESYYELACKTWRIHYTLVNDVVTVFNLRSGYQEEYLNGTLESRWDDVPLHKAFLIRFPL